jgi:hypothetical protein
MRCDVSEPIWRYTHGAYLLCRTPVFDLSELVRGHESAAAVH